LVNNKREGEYYGWSIKNKREREDYTVERRGETWISVLRRMQKTERRRYSDGCPSLHKKLSPWQNSSLQGKRVRQ
jgi:hypothetical protein